MTELNGTMGESSDIAEDEEITFRDVVSFLKVLISPHQILRGVGFLTLFILIGYIYKIWLWFDMCILESSGVPCRSDYTLFTMPFPIELGTAYAFLTGTDQTVVYSRSFFALDMTHFLCCFEVISIIGVRLALFFLAYKVWRVCIWDVAVNRFRRFKTSVVQHRRRPLVRANK